MMNSTIWSDVLAECVLPHSADEILTGVRRRHEGISQIMLHGILSDMVRGGQLQYDGTLYSSSLSRVLSALVPDRDAAERWLDVPREQFQGFSAREMMRKPGGADEVLGFLRGIGSGNFQ